MLYWIKKKTVENCACTVLPKLEVPIKIVKSQNFWLILKGKFAKIVVLHCSQFYLTFPKKCLHLGHCIIVQIVSDLIQMEHSTLNTMRCLEINWDARYIEAHASGVKIEHGTEVRQRNVIEIFQRYIPMYVF